MSPVSPPHCRACELQAPPASFTPDTKNTQDKNVGLNEL